MLPEGNGAVFIAITLQTVYYPPEEPSLEIGDGETVGTGPEKVEAEGWGITGKVSVGCGASVLTILTCFAPPEL